MTLAEEAAAIIAVADSGAFGTYPNNCSPVAMRAMHREWQTRAKPFVRKYGEKTRKVAGKIRPGLNDQELKDAIKELGFIWWLPLLIYGVQAIMALIRYWQDK
jgi:hypothetical protein